MKLNGLIHHLILQVFLLLWYLMNINAIKWPYSIDFLFFFEKLCHSVEEPNLIAIHPPQRKKLIRLSHEIGLILKTKITFSFCYSKLILFLFHTVNQLKINY